MGSSMDGQTRPWEEGEETVGSTLKSLREAVAIDSAHLGPEVEDAAKAQRRAAKLKERIDRFSTAWDVLEKISKERNKIRPDVAAIKDENGQVIVPAGWTDKNLKLRNEIGQKYDQLDNQLMKVSELQLAQPPDGAKIEEAYAKLAEITQKVSKGVKDTPDVAESDAS